MDHLQSQQNAVAFQIQLTPYVVCYFVLEHCSATYSLLELQILNIPERFFFLCWRPSIFSPSWTLNFPQHVSGPSHAAWYILDLGFTNGVAPDHLQIKLGFIDLLMLLDIWGFFSSLHYPYALYWCLCLLTLPLVSVLHLSLIIILRSPLIKWKLACRSQSGCSLEN